MTLFTSAALFPLFVPILDDGWPNRLVTSRNICDSSLQCNYPETKGAINLLSQELVAVVQVLCPCIVGRRAAVLWSNSFHDAGCQDGLSTENRGEWLRLRM